MEAGDALANLTVFELITDYHVEYFDRKTLPVLTEAENEGGEYPPLGPPLNDR